MHSDESELQGHGGQRPLKVLVLDDDPVFGRQLIMALKHSSGETFECVAVTTAEEARRAVYEATAPFDIFLVDQRLGSGPDGITVLHELLLHSPRSSAVVFTIAGDRESARRAHRAGAYRYLHKPFSIDDLMLVLATLRDWLLTRDKLAWLEVVNAFAQDAQQLHERDAIEQIIVRRGLDLGFDRALLWASADDGASLVGAASAGLDHLPRFRGSACAVAESPYFTAIVGQREPVVFDALERGERALMCLRATEGYPPPVGEWVGLPLRAGDTLVGVLVLDRRRPAPPFRRDHLLLQALGLFGRQVAAALERAMLQTETAILAEIGRLVGAEVADRPEAVLLEQVRQALGRRLDVENFFVAMHNERSGWLELLLDVEQGFAQELQPLPPGRGLVHQILVQNRPVLLRTPREIRAFRKAHGVARQLHEPPPQCWLGVPLQVAGRAVGALVVQSITRPTAYTEADQRFLETVAAQIAGPLHHRRLREAAEANSQRLAVIQQATAALMTMMDSDPGNERLWHTALTVITAGYGLGYNLAALFLLHHGNTVLRGRLAIGQRTLQQARRAWERNAGQSFADYARALIAGQLRPTLLDAPIRAVELPLSEASGALGEAIRGMGRVRVLQSELGRRLPAALVACLPPADYDVVPVVVGRRRIGAVLVGDPQLRRPLDAMPGDQLVTWLSQVALVVEGRRQQAAGAQLAQVSRTVLAGAPNRPLQETLREICASARVLMAASCAVIYPLVSDAGDEQPRLDVGRAGHDGLQAPLEPGEQPGPAGVITQLLATRRILHVEDIAQPPWGDPAPVANGFLLREKIQSFLAAPIFDHATGTPRGVLFINYRNRRSFEQRDAALVSSFAELAGQALHNYDDRATFEREQRVFAALLQNTLRLKLEAPEAEDELYKQILHAATELLDQPDARLGLVLRAWVRDPASGQPAESRREFFLVDGALEAVEDEALYQGITGRAFATGAHQLAEDVTQPPWAGIFVSRLSPRTRSELDILIRLDGQILGLINAESPRVGAFTAAHRASLERLANTAALALDASRTHQQLKELFKAAEPMIAAGDLSATLHAILAQILRLAPELAVVTIWYWDDQRRAMVPGVQHGVLKPALLREDPVLHETTVLGRMVHRIEPVWAEDAASHGVLRGRFVQEEGIVSSVAFPLQVGDSDTETEPVRGVPVALPPYPDGRQRTVIGALFLDYRHRHHFTRHERAILPIVAQVVAACIRDALNIERLRKQQRRVEAAARLARAVLGTTLELDETLRQMLATLRDLLQNENRSVELCMLLADEHEQVLSFAPASEAFYNWEIVSQDQTLPIEPPDAGQGPCSIAARVARQARVTREEVIQIVDDTAADPDYMQANRQTRAQLSLALVSPRDGRVLGVLVIEAHRVGAFTRADRLLVESLSPIISLAIERVRESRELRFNESVSVMTAWASQIAHDINKAVGEAKRAFYWLLKDAQPDQAHYIDRIKHNLNELQQLASASSKPETSKPYDLNPWLRDRVRQIIERRTGRPVRETIALAPEPLEVEANQFLLEWVLEHLIRNARQANPDACEISISTARSEGIAQIFFSNNGPPIPPEVRQHLFLEPIKGRHDRGRGLLLVRSMMKAMRGDIALIEPRAQVTFCLWLPLVPACAEGAATPARAVEEGAR